MAVEDGKDRRAAFLGLFERYAAALERLAGAYAMHREDREDLMQEIAAALWKALPRYRGEASERTWLYRVAHNVAITASVKRRRHEQQEVSSDDPPDPPSAPATAEQHLLDQERRDLLLEAVRALPLADRQVTVLHLEGLSGAEIEQVTGLSEGAIATRLTRIRNKLRTMIFEETGYGQS